MIWSISKFHLLSFCFLLFLYVDVCLPQSLTAPDGYVVVDRHAEHPSGYDAASRYSDPKQCPLDIDIVIRDQQGNALTPIARLKDKPVYVIPVGVEMTLEAVIVDEEDVPLFSNLDYKWTISGAHRTFFYMGGERSVNYTFKGKRQYDITAMVRAMYHTPCGAYPCWGIFTETAVEPDENGVLVSTTTDNSIIDDGLDRMKRRHSSDDDDDYPTNCSTTTTANPITDLTSTPVPTSPITPEPSPTRRPNPPPPPLPRRKEKILRTILCIIIIAICSLFLYLFYRLGLLLYNHNEAFREMVDTWSRFIRGLFGCQSVRHDDDEVFDARFIAGDSISSDKIYIPLGNVYRNQDNVSLGEGPSFVRCTVNQEYHNGLPNRVVQVPNVELSNIVKFDARLSSYQNGDL